jgi:outer membrane protein TolC
VSLQEAIQIAQQNHARVAVAEESVESARQQVRIARTGTLPSLIGEVGYQGRGTSNLGGLFGPSPTQTIPGTNGQPPTRTRLNTDTTTFDRGIQPRIGLSYTLYDAGFTRTSVRQARAGVEGSVANLGAVRNDLTLDVTSAYLAQLRADRILTLRQVQEELAAEQLRRVEARVREGAAAEADRALPLSEYRNRQVDRILAQNDVRVAANTLRNIMGLTVGPSLALVELREQAEPLPTVETLQDVALRERPEVVQAEAQMRVSQASVTLARIQRKPRLDTSFSFDVTPNDPFQRSNFAVGAAISMPLWDAGLTEARELQARTQVQSSAAQLEQTRKDVQADVVEAYLNLVNARERLEASRLAVEAAQVNLEQTTARYERGLAGVTVVDLIQAQVQFADASNSAIQALYDTHFAQAQLNRAIGRG